MVEVPSDLICPACGSRDIVPIIYDTTNLSDALKDDLIAGKAVLRNADDYEKPPRYYCRHCGYEW